MVFVISCCIFGVIKCFIFNRIVLGSSFIHQVICYLTVLNFCEMNRVLLEGIFKGFAFQKVFFWWGGGGGGFLSVVKYFLCFRNTLNSADPCW